MTVGRGGNGRDAVGLGARVGDVEVLLGFGLGYVLAEYDDEVLQRDALVATRLYERGGAFLQARHVHVLRRAAAGIALSVDGECLYAAYGSMVDKVKAVAGDDVTLGSGDGVGRSMRRTRCTADVTALGGHVVDACAQRKSADDVAFPDSVPRLACIAGGEGTVGFIDLGAGLHQFEADGGSGVHAFGPERERAQSAKVVHRVARAMDFYEVAVHVGHFVRGGQVPCAHIAVGQGIGCLQGGVGRTACTAVAGLGGHRCGRGEDFACAGLFVVDGVAVGVIAGEAPQVGIFILRRGFQRHRGSRAVVGQVLL